MIPLDLRIFNAASFILYPVFGYVPEVGLLFTFKHSLTYFRSKINIFCYIIVCNFYLKRKNKAVT